MAVVQVLVLAAAVPMAVAVVAYRQYELFPSPPASLLTWLLLQRPRRQRQQCHIRSWPWGLQYP